jgi:hypothetical protein
MLSSFLNKMRGGVSLCVILVFLHGEVSWSMGSERLIPGAPFATNRQQPATPTQPGEVQQTPAPQAPPNDSQTTVVQVPVPKDAGLDITVVDGDGGSNIVGKKSSTKPVVQVRDEKNQLLEGAVVTFIAPPDGPSVMFSNGLRTVTVMTDAEGRARAPSMRAVNGGSFRLQVSASFRGQMVSTSISQTNYESASEAKGKAPAGKPDTPVVNKSKGGLSGTAIAIIIGAGAAAAVGIGVGLGHGSSTAAATTTTTTTIGGPGTPTVGAPH